MPSTLTGGRHSGVCGRMGWTEGYSATQIKAIAGIEVLGGIGVILPWLTGIAKVLTPLVARGLAVTMVGALVVHGRRGEKESFPVNGALLALALVVSILRFTQL